MSRFSRLRSWCLIVASCAGLPAAAGNITVQNNSFESPPIPQGIPASTVTDNWTLTGTGTIEFNPFLGANVPAGAGVFPNPANPNDGSPAQPGQPYSNGHLDNADGNQVAFLFSNKGNSITQALVDPNTSQAITFAANQKYTLTASVAYATTPPASTDRLAFELYYVDSSQVTHVVMEGDLSNANASPAINQQTLQDYSFTSPLLAAGDPAVGQQINVGFFALDNNPVAPPDTTDNGEFDIDNVRLTAVPEPATLGLLSLAGLGFVRRRRA